VQLHTPPLRKKAKNSLFVAAAAAVWCLSWYDMTALYLWHYLSWKRLIALLDEVSPVPFAFGYGGSKWFADWDAGDGSAPGLEFANGNHHYDK
jgi:hypothetical protein